MCCEFIDLNEIKRLCRKDLTLSFVLGALSTQARNQVLLCGGG